MVAAFIILFREALEISIILSIIVAATRGIPGRARWIWAGIGGGLSGSALVAFFAERISAAMQGMGQEVFNAAVLFVAVLMITWTVVWMQKHGKELAQKFHHVGSKVREGSLPLYALATVVSLTMWREGAEIVLFLTGIISASGESLLSIAIGGLGGALAAGAIGWFLYKGLLKLHARYFFSITAALLMLLAAGMSAQAAGFLTAANVIPEWQPQLWDSSWLLSQSSVPGRILHALIGYSERPSGTQLLFYLLTLSIILALLRYRKKADPAKTTAPAAAL